eukprot:scaffold91629_cov59-Attheya_sp.AAC.3
MLMFKAPHGAHVAKLIQSAYQLVKLEEGAELTIVPSLMDGDNQDVIYVLQAGDEAMEHASMEYRHQPSYILFPELQAEKVVTVNLRKVVRSLLMRLKHADANDTMLVNLLKGSNASTSTGNQRPLFLIARNEDFSTVEGNSDGDLHDSDPELYAATQNPVASMMQNMERFHFE